LIRPCILAGSPEGGTVLDPFGGAGTTAVVCIEEGRNFILLEANPDYVGIMQRRLNDVQPRLFSSGLTPSPFESLDK
jgi:DNA modification methylase